ncbi:hypothetical protein FB451DRAFT_1297364 [Mycena latifolia]|nr:hypothetical protein FB451DRAFT_1297364 [Mycena latifolia]
MRPTLALPNDESAVSTVECDSASKRREGTPRLDSVSDASGRVRECERTAGMVGDAGAPRGTDGEGGRGIKDGESGVNCASATGVTANAEMSDAKLDSAALPGAGDGGRGSTCGSAGASDHACISGGERWCPRLRLSVGGGAFGTLRFGSSCSPNSDGGSWASGDRSGDGRGVSTSFTASSPEAGKFSCSGDAAGEFPPKRNSVNRSRFFASHSSLMRFAAVGRRSSADCSPGSGEATMAMRMSCCCSCTLRGSGGSSPRALRAAFRASCAATVVFPWGTTDRRRLFAGGGRRARAVAVKLGRYFPEERSPSRRVAPIEGGLELLILSPRNLNDLMLVPPREEKMGAGGWRTSAMMWGRKRSKSDGPHFPWQTGENRRG